MTLGDGWEVGGVVGRGGSATVYVAQDRTGRKAAVKILHPFLRQDPSHLERFRLEAELLAKLRHSAFVKVFESGVTDGGLPFLVMELLEGKPILDPDEPPVRKSLAEVVVIVRAVLEALSEMHALGAIHRDIKPANLHVTSCGSVKVIDLGIARTQGEGLTTPGTTIGTPGFMAPEQAFSARGSIGPATDIFAVGATAIVLLHGEAVRKCQGVLEAVLSPFPTTEMLGIQGPRAILDVFDRAIRYEAQDRFGTAAAMLDALDSALAATSPSELAAMGSVVVSEEPASPVEEPTAITRAPAAPRKEAPRHAKPTRSSNRPSPMSIPRSVRRTFPVSRPPSLQPAAPPDTMGHWAASTIDNQSHEWAVETTEQIGPWRHADQDSLEHPASDFTARDSRKTIRPFIQANATLVMPSSRAATTRDSQPDFEAEPPSRPQVSVQPFMSDPLGWVLAVLLVTLEAVAVAIRRLATRRAR